ncbi:hypothetical protein [Methylomicrobium album]|uniref:Uncharacterized protein n=1 Tax=Methylomicrobium album BG8 TaxID=686340 RepID=H8GGB2_METAL|nr:hypothetical protein [Methylomicrobium album]EIC31192.1 hypothetical protein Metal_3544 [Methylomicrobium album BG8]
MSKEIGSTIQKSATLITIWPAGAANQMGQLINEFSMAESLLSEIRLTNQSIPIKAGLAAEILHAETFNADAILKDSNLRAYTDRHPNSSLPKNHQTHDIVVTNGEQKVHGAQLKYYQDGEKTANAFRETTDGVPKYKEADSLIGPSDQLNDIKKSARRTELKNLETRPDVAEAAKDVQNKATDRLSVDDVESKPLTSAESKSIAKGNEQGKQQHEAIQNDYKTRSLVNQSLNAAKSAAVITACISGTINVVNSLSKLQKKQISPQEAALEILTNTAIASADAALKAGAGTAAVSLTASSIPQIFAGSMLKQNLVGGSIAGAAVCSVDLVQCLVKVAMGKMTPAELETRTGKNIFQTGSGVSGASIGAVIGAPAGPVGALVGSLIGGMIVSVATTIAIENHIERAFFETLDNTEKLVESEQILFYSLEHLEQSQQLLNHLQIQNAIAEQNFNRQLGNVKQLGQHMFDRIEGI